MVLMEINSNDTTICIIHPRKSGVASFPTLRTFGKTPKIKIIASKPPIVPKAEKHAIIIPIETITEIKKTILRLITLPAFDYYYILFIFTFLQYFTYTITYRFAAFPKFSEFPLFPFATLFHRVRMLLKKIDEGAHAIGCAKPHGSGSGVIYRIPSGFTGSNL